VNEPANQISVSPSGHIVWRLHRGRVFAGTKITHKRPEGLKWVEAVQNVVYISVDDHCAWYVKAFLHLLQNKKFHAVTKILLLLHFNNSWPIHLCAQVRQVERRSHDAEGVVERAAMFPLYLCGDRA
jgi:hypothetical protein